MPPIPFSSGYAPINLLNNAIQAQAAGQDRGYLDAAKINQQEIADSLNRIIQQKAIEQQGRNEQARNALLQQQLANDLANRNQSFGLLTQQQAEAKRQFDAKLALDQAIANANIRQMDRPGYGMGKDFGLGVYQGAQDVAAHNAAATAIASQATAALDNARKAYNAEVAQIKDPTWYQSVYRHLPLPTATQDDLLTAAKAKFDANYAKLIADLGPHRDKVQFTGTPEGNGTFQPVLLQAPQMPGFSPAPAPAGTGAEPQPSGPANVGNIDVNTPENQPLPQTSNPNPFSGVFGGIAGSLSPVLGQFMRQNSRTNAPPVVAVPPVQVSTPQGGVRFFNLNPDGTIGLSTTMPGTQ